VPTPVPTPAPSADFETVSDAPFPGDADAPPPHEEAPPEHPPWDAPPSPVSPPPPPAVPAASTSTTSDGPPPFWADLIDKVNPSVRGFLSSSEARMEGDVLHLVPGSGFASRMLQKENVREEIADKLSALLGRPCQLRVGRVEPPGAKPPNPLFEQLAKKIEALQEEERKQ